MIDSPRGILVISKEEAARRAEELERLVPLMETEDEREELQRLASALWAQA